MLRLWCFVWLLCYCATPISGRAKIIGGSRAPRGRVPYIVSMQAREGHFCGGVIYNNRTIITAAHCLEDEGPITSFRIRAGSLIDVRGGVLARVSGARKHPRYNPANRHYDLAVVYLRNALTFNANIQPIKLFSGPLRSGQRAIVSGWGITSEDGYGPDNLRILPVRVIRGDLCKRSYRRLDPQSQFCAGFWNGVRDACDGDSGGPLEVNGRLAGIVSDGKGCARRRYPSIYTRIPNLRTWIVNNAAK